MGRQLKRVKDIQAFLGPLPTFTAALFKISQKIATPLNNFDVQGRLYGGGGGTQQKAFEQLKKRFGGRTYFW